ncbi:MAG: class II aldolase/adducin family protein [Acidobacteria bacterium]|nr:class II aldolase/adducin family protein [Acidobacteriota bacterium]
MQTMERIYHYRMTTTSGGNLSLHDADGSIWITPARVDKGNIRREDIVCVRPDGRVEGLHPPSSELPFHRMIYTKRPDLRGIVHAHPVALVAFSITRQVPDTRLFHQSMTVCGKPGFAPYALPGSERLGANVAEIFAEGFDSVLLENHGVVVGGETLQNAFQRFETLEFTAKTTIKARILGACRLLTDDELELPHRFKKFAEFEPDPPTSEEKELRRELCEFTRRGYRQRLFISTGGSFSARLSDDSFLITPYRVDRQTLREEDLVLVKNGRQEAGKRASRASRNHAAVYAAHPSIDSIINAFPVNTTAFGVTRTELNSRTIPESYILLRDVGRAPYGSQFHNGAELAAVVSPEKPIVLLENDGVLVVGASVLEAFDRLEVLESTAEALINSRLLGDVAPMSDAVIDELKAAFLGC